MPQSRSSRPTQRDIAELAGVSITTVSHVVNGTRAVAEDTKAAVLRAIEATGYTGDAIARSLVTGGTRSIGMAISLVANPYFAVLMQAIEREASAHGYTVLLAATHDPADTERDTVRALRSEAGYSQESFADAIGVHRTSMGTLERGDGNPTLDMIVRVAKGLRLSLSELFQAVEKDTG